MENNRSEIWKTTLNRIAHLENLIFTTVGLLMGLLYFSLSRSATDNFTEIFALSLVLIMINFVFIHLIVILMAFTETLLDIEAELEYFNLWHRCFKKLKSGRIFFVTYPILVFTPSLLTNATIFYLFRNHMYWGVPIAGIGFLLSFSLLISAIRKHINIYSRTGSCD